MKFLVREAARAAGIPVIMETSDRGVLDVERFDLEPDRPMFHGLLGDMDSPTLAGLSLAEKSPFVLRLLGANEVSARGAASLFELGTTVTGWPQLASEVTLGAVTAAAAVRRFGLWRGAALGTRALRRRGDHLRTSRRWRSRARSKRSYATHRPMTRATARVRSD